MYWQCSFLSCWNGMFRRFEWTLCSERCNVTSHEFMNEKLSARRRRRSIAVSRLDRANTSRWKPARHLPKTRLKHVPNNFSQDEKLGILISHNKAMGKQESTRRFSNESTWKSHLECTCKHYFLIRTIQGHTARDRQFPRHSSRRHLSTLR